MEISEIKIIDESEAGVLREPPELRISGIYAV